MLNTLRQSRFGFASAALILFLIAGCNMPAASTPTPDLFATLQASTPLTAFTPNPLETPTPAPLISNPVDLPTATASPISTDGVPSPTAADGLTGHIVFTCQIFKVQASNQICIMNADGTGFRRLTTDNNRQHFYPSLSPDGRSVLYSGFFEKNNYEIYELTIADGALKRLTNIFTIETAPEFSPDGERIIFARENPSTQRFQLIMMSSNGKEEDNVPNVTGWDPTWSPDGSQILFASDKRGPVQLFKVNPNGKGLKVITDLPAIRGRSDWSADGRSIVTYSGPAWNRELYIMSADGTNSHQLTPSGGNSQGPSFSPDGKWVVFTSYFDNYGDDNGCEIYVIRVDGTDLRRLTNNDYCDYQPRWGP
ncbi:MAG: PD40 domain-containing protein [Anaerolineales bacterium]|nr:PD40 domain-containing protein [Anaerolineales bacterium]